MANKAQKPKIIHFTKIGPNDKIPKPPKGFSTCYFGGCIHQVNEAWMDRNKKKKK